tara:strand:- start:122 stop:1606 length:1485 start_codon:yes stop_codon:yes gene_type:complete
MSYLPDFDEKFKWFIKNSPINEKKHQKDGIHWMYEKETGKSKKFLNGTEEIYLPRGGVLADEMGLGKTIQLIGLMAFHPIKTLIVVPVALLDQWANEILRIAGHNAVIYHGINKRNISLEQISMAKSMIVITTYGEISERKNKLGDVLTSSIIHLVSWKRIIFDEAHHLRNKNTGVHKGATKLKAEYKWLATGTPIQNRPKDLHNLMKVVGYTNSYWDDLLLSSKLEFIKKHAFLKRTKQTVDLNLKPVIDETIIVPWSNPNEKYLAENLHSVFNFCSLNSNSTIDSAIACLESEKGILPLLIRARQSCILPEMLSVCLNKFLENNRETEIDFSKIMEISSKLDAVEKHVISRKETGMKLLFCHFRKEIDELEKRLTIGGLKVNKIDGRTNIPTRREIIREDCDVLILQIQTGCEGLNLQQYSEVYFVSPHWNPAIEDQAVARCHRIGQTEKIHIFRFEMECFNKIEGTKVTSQTLDFYCNLIQKIKREYYTII